jgi:anti-sigma-K factor RskA
MSTHPQFDDDLALYALEALDGPERHTLEKHLETCASCRRELELLRGDSSLLALTTVGPKPPSRSKQRLMAAIASEPRLPANADALAASSRARSWWPSLGWLAAAALVVLCLGLLRQNTTLQKDISSVRAEFQTQLDDQGRKLQDANETVATLLDPEATRIELVAAGNKPQPRGKAIYQKRSRNLIFFASNLPPLPAEKVYELWLFPANGGAPIAAGLFKPDARGGATVVNPPLPEGVEAKNFVVTLEPETGSHDAPRGTPVIVGVGL